MSQQKINERLALIGKRTQEGIESLRSRAYDITMTANTAERAWGNREWRWLRDNNVISRDIYELARNLENEQAVIDSKSTPEGPQAMLMVTTYVSGADEAETFTRMVPASTDDALCLTIVKGILFDADVESRFLNGITVALDGRAIPYVP